MHMQEVYTLSGAVPGPGDPGDVGSITQAAGGGRSLAWAQVLVFTQDLGQRVALPVPGTWAAFPGETGPLGRGLCVYL